MDTKKPLLKFCYLGDRDYLDITSIFDSLWNFFGLDIRASITEMTFKINFPIVQNCYLDYSTHQRDSNSTDAAEFTWIQNNTQFFGYLIPNGTIFTDRTEEPKWDFESFCEFSNDRVILKNNFKIDTCYNMTKMGKFLISKYQDPNVRIVKFYFKELIPSKEMIGISLRLQKIRGGFLKIICENNVEEFGHIIAKESV
jgi:hypothetical protein